MMYDDGKATHSQKQEAPPRLTYRSFGRNTSTSVSRQLQKNTHTPRESLQNQREKNERRDAAKAATTTFFHLTQENHQNRTTTVVGRYSQRLRFRFIPNVITRSITKLPLLHTRPKDRDATTTTTKPKQIPVAEGAHSPPYDKTLNVKRSGCKPEIFPNAPFLVSSTHRGCLPDNCRSTAVAAPPPCCLLLCRAQERRARPSLRRIIAGCC